MSDDVTRQYLFVDKDKATKRFGAVSNALDHYPGCYVCLQELIENLKGELEHGQILKYKKIQNMEHYLKLCKDYHVVTDIKRLNKDIFLKIHPNITDEDYNSLLLVLSGKHDDLKVLPVKFHTSKSGFCEDCFKGVINDRYYIRQQQQNRELVIWTTATKEFEPDTPLAKGVHVLVFDSGKFIHEEVIFGRDADVPYRAESGTAIRTHRFMWE